MGKNKTNEPNYDDFDFQQGRRITVPKTVKGKINNGYGDIEFEASPLFSETLTESQKKISEVCDSMKDLLLYKNKKYGDSALNPNNVFYKGDSTNSIKIRLDDKIGRIKNCEETRVNDVSDLIGYSVLLLASMNVTKEDIAKFKD